MICVKFFLYKRVSLCMHVLLSLSAFVFFSFDVSVFDQFDCVNFVCVLFYKFIYFLCKCNSFESLIIVIMLWI